ncbi:MAG: iron-sulfur cluster repair di-iron protein [Acidobacteria bacterium]|nr:iron-sulfur cluster repair di-iron protein [Acidobacteriota bacterium]
MILTANKTVGEIAAENPSAVRIFEKHGIDYCCGGGHPLEQACREKGLSAEQVLAEVEKAAAPEEYRDWTSAPLSELIDHIVARHHTYLKEELPALTQVIGKVIEAHGTNHGGSLRPLRTTLLGLKDELDLHMMKEEAILFPLIQQMETAEKSRGALAAAHCGSVNNPIRVMEHEHDSAAAALREMRQVTTDYTLPLDACNTYRGLFHRLQEMEADLHLHIHLENNILFPRASQLEARLLSQ